MTTVSCIIITTLIVVSLANLVLLVHVIMHSMVKCDQARIVTKKIQKKDNILKTIRNKGKYSFVAALVVLFGDDDNFDFVCGVATISKKWALTSAHCVDVVLHEPKEKIKIVSSVSKMKYPEWYDIDNIVVHEGYDESLTNNLAVIGLVQSFKEKEVDFVALPNRSYKYLANSTATALRWSGNELIGVDVKLTSYKVCQSAYFDRVSDANFCAERRYCFFDNGGFLVQEGLLVGVVSSGVGCGVKPVVYSRVSAFEEWFRKRKVGAVFKV